MSKKSMLLAALSVCWLAAPASAQPLDRRTFYTFKTPVEMPGATLPPGKYLFRFVNPDSSSGVIQVLSDADKKVWGTFFTIPTQRPDLPDKPEIRFMETPAGTPRAIKTMWYIGERTGREVLYPREQALRLAKATKEPVLTTRTASAASTETKTEDMSRVSPAGQDTAVAENTAQNAPSGVAEPGETAPQSYSIPPQQMASASQPSQTVGTGGRQARTRLPRTASNLPLIGLIGFSLLGAGVGLLALGKARA